MDRTGSLAVWQLRQAGRMLRGCKLMVVQTPSDMMSRQADGSSQYMKIWTEPYGTRLWKWLSLGTL